MIDKQLSKKLISKDSIYLSRIKILFKFFGIKLKIRWNKDNSCAMPTENWIEIGMLYEDASLLNITDFLSLSMHELAHMINFRDGKYMLYHRIDDFDTSSIEEISTFIRTAIKAEKYTDKRAARMCKLFFPEIKYSPSYTKHTVKWYKDEFLSDAYDSLFQKIIDEEGR